MAVLSLEIPKKHDEQIRGKVQRNECLCCSKQMYRNALCSSCYEERRDEIARMTKPQRVAYIGRLRKRGLYLFPYEMRKFKKPVSLIRRLAQ